MLAIVSAGLVVIWALTRNAPALRLTLFVRRSAGQLEQVEAGEAVVPGPRDRVRDRLQVYKDAGVGTLITSPMAFDVEQRRRMVMDIAELV